MRLTAEGGIRLIGGDGGHRGERQKILGIHQLQPCRQGVGGLAAPFSGKLPDAKGSGGAADAGQRADSQALCPGVPGPRGAAHCHGPWSSDRSRAEAREVSGGDLLTAQREVSLGGEGDHRIQTNSR